jgi:hypothetical protein
MASNKENFQSVRIGAEQETDFQAGTAFENISP